MIELSPDRHPRHSARTRTRAVAVRLAVLAAVAAVIGLAVVRMTTPPSKPQLLAMGAQPVTGSGSCDVTGVHVAYATAWQPSPAPARHVVTSATVDSIDQPSCQGAVLKVILRNGTTNLGTATATLASATTATVSFSPGVPAASVNDVFVELNGGATPVPTECESMKLDNVLLGTTGNDTISDTKGSSLLYGLGGNDTVSSGNKADCIVLGDGTNSVSGSSGDDVVLTGNGKNTVDTGPGADLVRFGTGNGNTITTGPGEDTVYLGSGTGNSVDGGTGNNNVCHVPFPVSQVAAHGDVIKNCKVVTP